MDELYTPTQAIYQLAQQNNEWSAAQAQKQMDFQERMANTAHVREVADLKAAGLNPVLSAHTNGAASPSGAMGQTDTNTTAVLADLLGQMINSDTAKTIAGYGYGSGYGLGLTDTDTAAKKPTGNYTFDMKGLSSFLGDIWHSIFDETPRETVDRGVHMVKDWRTNLEEWKKENPGKYYDPDAGMIKDLPTSVGDTWLGKVLTKAKNITAAVAKFPKPPSWKDIK